MPNRILHSGPAHIIVFDSQERSGIGTSNSHGTTFCSIVNSGIRGRAHFLTGPGLYQRETITEEIDGIAVERKRTPEEREKLLLGDFARAQASYKQNPYIYAITRSETLNLVIQKLSDTMLYLLGDGIINPEIVRKQSIDSSQWSLSPLQDIERRRELYSQYGFNLVGGADEELVRLISGPEKKEVKPQKI